MTISNSHTPKSSLPTDLDQLWHNAPLPQVDQAPSLPDFFSDDEESPLLTPSTFSNVSASTETCAPQATGCIEAYSERKTPSLTHDSQRNVLNEIAEQENLSPFVTRLVQRAEKGDAEALNELGLCCYEARGIAQKLEHAAALFGIAAEQGYPPAQWNFAYCFQYGKKDRKFKPFSAFFPCGGEGKTRRKA